MALCCWVGRKIAGLGLDRMFSLEAANHSLGCMLHRRLVQVLARREQAYWMADKARLTVDKAFARAGKG